MFLSSFWLALLLRMPFSNIHLESHKYHPILMLKFGHPLCYPEWLDRVDCVLELPFTCDKWTKGEIIALPPYNHQMGCVYMCFLYFAPTATFLICCWQPQLSLLHDEHLAGRCMPEKFIFTVISQAGLD